MMRREFVATVYVVHNNKVLLVFHKKLKKWLPPGGHIDDNELPDETAVREVKEETGIDIELVGEKQHKMSDIVEPLRTPEVVQVEDIEHDNEVHQHIDLFYLAVPKTHKICMSDESLDLRWFSLEDMEKEKVPKNIKYTARLMIEKVKTIN